MATKTATRRIPSKTIDRVAYNRYWRDRFALEKIVLLEEEIKAVLTNCDEKRLPHYTAAIEAMQAAIKEFRKGWLL